MGQVPLAVFHVQKPAANIMEDNGPLPPNSLPCRGVAVYNGAGG